MNPENSNQQPQKGGTPKWVWWMVVWIIIAAATLGIAGCIGLRMLEEWWNTPKHLIPL